MSKEAIFVVALTDEDREDIVNTAISRVELFLRERDWSSILDDRGYAYLTEGNTVSHMEEASHQIAERISSDVLKDVEMSVYNVVQDSLEEQIYEFEQEKRALIEGHNFSTHVLVDLTTGISAGFGSRAELIRWLKSEDSEGIDFDLTAVLEIYDDGRVENYQLSGWFSDYADTIRE